MFKLNLIGLLLLITLIGCQQKTEEESMPPTPSVTSAPPPATVQQGVDTLNQSQTVNQMTQDNAAQQHQQIDSATQ
ncbi:MAG: hypothetical protein RL637_883 [Pseudomonadota bacterium]|jgi:hypothetical protein